MIPPEMRDGVSWGGEGRDCGIEQGKRDRVEQSSEWSLKRAEYHAADGGTVGGTGNMAGVLGLVDSSQLHALRDLGVVDLPTQLLPPVWIVSQYE